MEYDMIIGIDPGVSGGIAYIKSTGEYRVISMPKTEHDISDAFGNLSKTKSIYAFIEDVHSFPGQGVASSFKFGWGYGGLRMALIDNKIPFVTVGPRKWQKALGIAPRKKNDKKQFIETHSEFKNRLKALAQQLFPDIRFTLATCDAMLICEYGRRLQQNRLI